MTAVRRLIAFALLGVILVAVGGLATGRLAHVTTSGVSMEPTYSAGDLVVIGESTTYDVGDIVAFRIPGDDTLVLHRIIGGDETGFTIRGDNNESIDPHQPAAEEILGRELVHVPRVGALLTSPLVRGALLVPVLALLGVMTMSPKRDRTTSTERTPGVQGRGRVAALAWKLLVAADVVLLIALGVVQFAGVEEVGDADVAEPTQTAALGYHAEVGRSDTYPDGEVSTGEPAFTNLLDRVDVTFRHTSDTPGAVTGTVRLDAAISTASGWESVRELVEPTEFEGDGSELEATLVLPQIQALAGRVAEATGVPAGTIAIVVTASGEASLDGAAAEPFSVDLPLQLSPTALTLTGEATDRTDGPVVASTSPLAKTPGAGRSDGSDRDLRTPLLVALLAAVAATVALWPTSEKEDEELVPATVDALAVQLPTTTVRIEIADRQALSAIASTAGRPIVTASDWEGVLTADALYWCARGAGDEPRPLRGRAAEAVHDRAEPAEDRLEAVDTGGEVRRVL